MMKKLLSILVVCAVAASAMAVPAKRGGTVMTTEDGTEKTVFLHGDEFFHYMTDAEGNWLDEETLLPMKEEIKNEKLRIKEGPAKARRIKHETGTDRLLSPRGAVILVSYADLAFKSTKEGMEQWAMGDTYTYNGATGSIHQYFIDQSWGQYNLQIDVIGPVVVSKNYAYYGANDYSGNDKHADELIVEACTIAHDSLGVDFSRYDSDNDGEVDWVVIIYAGKGEASGGAANTIWPHQWDLSESGMDFKLDGKTVNHYCCLNELKSNMKRDGIGTFCHEFSHVMGLPDLYATNEAYHHTMCEWDIMDYGPYNNDGNTPPNYSAYERWFMGWYQPRLVNSAASVILPPLHETAGAVYMTANGAAIDDILQPNPKTFYLFENRQLEGWDEFLPGPGLMITKVQWSSFKWENNTVNNSAGGMGVDIMEATANTSYEEGASTDLYPAGGKSFTQIVSYQVTNIAMANQVITFDVNGGGANINLGVENIESDQPAVKRIENGKVIIVRDGQKYDLLGNRL